LTNEHQYSRKKRSLTKTWTAGRSTSMAPARQGAVPDAAVEGSGSMATNRVFRHVSGTAVHCSATAEISFERRAGNGSRALCDTGCRWKRRIGPRRGIDRRRGFHKAGDRPWLVGLVQYLSWRKSSISIGGPAAAGWGRPRSPAWFQVAMAAYSGETC
jgi:hypothetical protein